MELVKQYRTPDANQKQRAVQQLRTMGWVGYRVMAKLRREETVVSRLRRQPADAGQL